MIKKTAFLITLFLLTLSTTAFADTQGCVLIEYRLLDGRFLSEPDFISGPIGTAYDLAIPNFKNYQLIAEPFTATGVYKETVILVVFSYVPLYKPSVELY